MRWYNRLYVGKKAKRYRRFIIKHIREQKFQSGAYVITPASNGNNILDIYPAVVLLHPEYASRDYLVIGIAAGYWEALEVVRQIVDDLYRQTGGFDLDSFIDEKR